MQFLLKFFITQVLIFHVLFVHASDDARSEYQAAFTVFYTEQSKSMLTPLLTKQGISEAEAKQRVDKFIDGTIQCHMTTMDMNSTRITDPTYEVVEKGGNYIDAKNRFDADVQRALAENDTEILEPLRDGISFAQECVKKHTVEAGF